MKTLVGAACIALLAGCAVAPRAGPSAVAFLESKSGTDARGKITFLQGGDKVMVTGAVIGLSPGPHGFHIHENGDCSAPDAASAGGHFNPTGVRHGGPGNGHAGDMGNIEADMYGKAEIEQAIAGRSVSEGPRGIIGRAVVVHLGPDDLKSDPAGNSGTRIACGVITKN